MNYGLIFLTVFYMLGASALQAKDRGKDNSYPTAQVLRAALLPILAEANDSFRRIRKGWEPHPEDPAEHAPLHILAGDKPGMFSLARGPRAYENLLHVYRDEDAATIAFFKWQELIARALPGHLLTVPAYRIGGATANSGCARYYYCPGGDASPGAVVSVFRQGKEVWLRVVTATPDDIARVHAYNDGVPYAELVLMAEGCMYDSTFKNNHYSGMVFKQQNFGGGWYRGYMADGQPEGEGEAYFAATGEEYVGTFLRGKYHGKGVLVKGGTRYEGEFQDGTPVEGAHRSSKAETGYTITTPGRERYASYAASPAVVTARGICEKCRGTGLTSKVVTCFGCAGKGSSGTGYKTYDAHGYETGYKSLGCSYCGGTGLSKKFVHCGDCRGKGRL